MQIYRAYVAEQLSSLCRSSARRRICLASHASVVPTTRFYLVSTTWGACGKNSDGEQCLKLRAHGACAENLLRAERTEHCSSRRDGAQAARREGAGRHTGKQAGRRARGGAERERRVWEGTEQGRRAEDEPSRGGVRGRSRAGEASRGRSRGAQMGEEQGGSLACRPRGGRGDEKGLERYGRVGPAWDAWRQ
jgi:hypothetical protein